MKKLCPFWAASAVLEKAAGPCECIEDDCQLWCPESTDEFEARPNKYYRAGCGLMPKENRKI